MNRPGPAVLSPALAGLVAACAGLPPLAPYVAQRETRWRKWRRGPERRCAGDDPRGKLIAGSNGRVRVRWRVRINGRKVAVVVRP